MWFPAPAVTGTPHNITQLTGPRVCSCFQSLDIYIYTKDIGMESKAYEMVYKDALYDGGYGGGYVDRGDMYGAPPLDSHSYYDRAEGAGAE